MENYIEKTFVNLVLNCSHRGIFVDDDIGYLRQTLVDFKLNNDSFHDRHDVAYVLCDH